MNMTIGIDIGGTRIKAALVDEDGHISCQINEPSSARGSYLSILTQLVDLIQQLGDHSEEQPVGIGLAVAGLMDQTCETVVASPNCTEFIGRRLAEDLSDRVKLPVIMDNDANMMALGEGAYGAARGSRHYIAITVGTGVGGAVISDGRLIRGIDGGGGELGHIPISRNGPKCGCGSVGCLEAFVGHTGIRRFISKHVPELERHGLKEINQLADEGMRDAVEVFTYIGKNLGIAMAGLVNVFNPEFLVIGGGVAAAGKLIFRPLTEELKRRSFETYMSSLRVRPAELRNWAGVAGAAKVVRENLSVTSPS